MLVTSSALIIEFKENASLFISSESKCHFEISSSAHLELWTKDQKNPFPIRYEYVPELGRRCNEYFQRLHERYYYLMRDTNLNTSFDIMPSFGYNVMSLGWNSRFLTLDTEEERQTEMEKEQEYCTTARSFCLNQYGTNFEPEERKEEEEEMDIEIDLLTRIIGSQNSLQSRTYTLSHKQLSHIKVYFKDADSALPRFTLKDDRNKKRLYFTVIEDHYTIHGESYMIYGLCIVPGGPMMCHFMISANRQFMLFLPTLR